MKSFTLEEINCLVESGNYIVIANNNVYNITEYLKKHPGGQFVIKSNNGKVVDRHYNMHPKHAKKKWKTFKIGVLQKEPCCNCIIT
ncbi:MAG: cytochrome b5-like heme/steroid binding domain-containing protein [Candidatus Neomarinimicrobiota bacterium]